MKLRDALSAENLADNGPVIFATAMAFGGSFYTIAEFIGHYGDAGFLQFADAGLPDLLCFSAVREYIRDRRTGRERKFGFTTWPVIVFVIGLLETLTLNWFGNIKTPLGQGPATFWGHALALLAGTTLILGGSLIHRRDSGPRAAGGQGDTHQAAPAGWRVPEPVSAGRVSAELILSHPVSPWPVSPEPIPETPVSDPPVSPGPVSPEPEWLEVLSGGGEPGPEPDSAPGEGAGVTGEGKKQRWTVDELTQFARENWPVSQRTIKPLLAKHPRGGAGQHTVVQAIRAVREEKGLASPRRRAVND